MQFMYDSHAFCKWVGCQCVNMLTGTAQLLSWQHHIVIYSHLQPQEVITADESSCSSWTVPVIYQTDPCMLCNTSKRFFNMSIFLSAGTFVLIQIYSYFIFFFFTWSKWMNKHMKMTQLLLNSFLFPKTLQPNKWHKG